MVAAVAIVLHSIFGRPSSGPSRVGSACGSVVDPLGVSRYTESQRFGCAAKVAFGMNRAGNAPFNEYKSPTAMAVGPHRPEKVRSRPPWIPSIPTAKAMLTSDRST